MGEILSNYQQNDASSDSWLLILPFGDLRLIARKTTDFDMPGVNAEGTIGPRFGGVATFNVSSDTVYFDPVVFTFIVDENYKNYNAMLARILRTPKMEMEEVYFQFTVVPLSNTKKDMNVSYTYLDATLSNLSTVSLDTTAGVKTLTCTATFKFGGMILMENGQVIVDTTQL